MDIRMIESDKCERDVGIQGYELLEPLFNWRGINAGCYKDGNVTVGSCSGSGSGAKDIPTLKARPLNMWKGRHFCVLRSPVNEKFVTSSGSVDPGFT